MTQPANLLIGTPAYGGQVHARRCRFAGLAAVRDSI